MIDVLARGPVQKRSAVVVTEADGIGRGDELVGSDDSVREPDTSKVKSESEWDANNMHIDRHLDTGIDMLCMLSAGRGNVPVYPADGETNTAVQEAARELHHGRVYGHEGRHLAQGRHDG